MDDYIPLIKYGVQKAGINMLCVRTFINKSNMPSFIIQLKLQVYRNIDISF